MTNTIFAFFRSPSTSPHSRSESGDPKLYAATLRSSLCARLISRSACLSGASKLVPTYKIVIFNPCNPWLYNAFELVFPAVTNLSQFLEHVLVNFPVPAPVRLQQSLRERVRGVRIQISQTLQHPLIKQKRVRHFRVNPIINRIRRRAPSERVRYMVLNLRDAAKPVLQHPFIPLRIECLGPRLQAHCLFQRSNLPFTRQSVRQIDRGPRFRALLHRLRHATEILKIVVHIGQADLERVEVLVRRLDTPEG